MCFHYALSKKAQDLEHRYKAKFKETDLFEPIFHGSAFEKRKWPVITNNNLQNIQQLRWGLIPSWIKTPEEAKKISTLTINAVSETAFDKPSFRNSISKKRCLIPSTGFFEWQTIKSIKYPYFITLKDQPIFSMAGLWEEWTDTNTGEIINTFSILTTNANPFMEKIHNTKKRMPVILPEDIEMEWLNNDLKKDDILSLCKPIDNKLMNAITISKLVSSKTEYTNQPEVQNEFNYPELLTLGF
jgi:putative SOS response-associated peptidase YedK